MKEPLFYRIVRPIVTLKSKIKVTGGSGKIDDPWKIEL